jgi:hypothetical protein
MNGGGESNQNDEGSSNLWKEAENFVVLDKIKDKESFYSK